MRVLLTYDFISTRIDRGHDKHLERFSFLIPLFEKIGIKVIKDNGTFSRKKLKEYMGMLDTNNSYEPINIEDLNKKSISYIKKHTNKCDIVFGYELLPQTRKIFEALGIIYIDMWLSPIRFYKDIMFEFYSNDKKIQKIFKKNIFNNKELFLESNRIKKFFNEFESKKIELQNNSVLLVGQVLEDKSVLRDKKYLNILDFESEIIELANQYEMIYFLKHPLMKASEFKMYREKLQAIQNITYLEDVNSYYLLTQAEIKLVVGISSSVLTEGIYFEKDVHYFYKPVLGSEYIRIYKPLFESSFWAKIFDIKIGHKSSLFVYDNYLRQQYNLFYAYKAFMGVDLDKKISQRASYDILIELVNFIERLDKNKKYILYGFGSVGRLVYPHIKKNLVGIIDKSLQIDAIEGIKVLNLEQLKKYRNTTILATPFIYNESITQTLASYENEVIFLR